MMFSLNIYFVVCLIKNLFSERFKTFCMLYSKIPKISPPFRVGLSSGRAYVRGKEVFSDRSEF